GGGTATRYRVGLGGLEWCPSPVGCGGLPVPVGCTSGGLGVGCAPPPPVVGGGSPPAGPPVVGSAVGPAPPSAGTPPSPPPPGPPDRVSPLPPITLYEHSWSFSVNLFGSGFAAWYAPVKRRAVVAPGARSALTPESPAVIVCPDCCQSADQPCTSRWSPSRENASVQPVRAWLPEFLTVMSTVNAPFASD